MLHDEDAVSPEVRCSAVVFRGQEVLLVHRVREGSDDWVLPGGTPRPGEAMGACARREILEETGIAAEPGRIAFVLESHSPESGAHTLDLVFLAALSAPGQEPRSAEPDLTASFVPLSSLHQLDLRPPLAGYLRGLNTRQPGQTAAYLGNLWRPRRHDEPENVLFGFAEPPPWRRCLSPADRIPETPPPTKGRP